MVARFLWSEDQSAAVKKILLLNGGHSAEQIKSMVDLPAHVTVKQVANKINQIKKQNKSDGNTVSLMNQLLSPTGKPNSYLNTATPNTGGNKRMRPVQTPGPNIPDVNEEAATNLYSNSGYHTWKKIEPSERERKRGVFRQAIAAFFLPGSYSDGYSYPTTDQCGLTIKVELPQLTKISTILSNGFRMTIDELEESRVAEGFRHILPSKLKTVELEYTINFGEEIHVSGAHKFNVMKSQCDNPSINVYLIVVTYIDQGQIADEMTQLGQ